MRWSSPESTARRWRCSRRSSGWRCGRSSNGSATRASLSRIRKCRFGNWLSSTAPTRMTSCSWCFGNLAAAILCRGPAPVYAASQMPQSRRSPPRGVPQHLWRGGCTPERTAPAAALAVRLPRFSAHSVTVDLSSRCVGSLLARECRPLGCVPDESAALARPKHDGTYYQ